jgi:hypothetical protein
MYSEEVVKRGYDVVAKNGLLEYIHVDVRDVFNINAEELKLLKIEYISTTAAVNSTFNARLIHLALKSDIRYVCMPTQSLQELKEYKLFKFNGKSIRGATLFFKGNVQVNDGCPRNISKLDLIHYPRLKGLQYIIILEATNKNI